MLSMEGLIKCTVLLTRRLYHLVLPFRCNNKLLFCLCKTCAVECNFGVECVHDTEWRASSEWHLGPRRDSTGDSEGLQGDRHV